MNNENERKRSSSKMKQMVHKFLLKAHKLTHTHTYFSYEITKSFLF